MPPHFWDSKDTIAARATAPGGGVRGAIRISGPDAVAVVAKLLDADGAANLQHLRAAKMLESSLELPGFPCALEAQILAWPDARSYTRQPSVEIHTLGSPPILDAILERLFASGARAAQPGEFTLRSFLAGRLDLTQAEAVLGVIDAVDQSQLDEALGQLAGGLATPLHALRDQLIELLAHLEAGLDFVDEDIEFITADQLASDLEQIDSAVESIASQLEQRLDRGDLPSVALFGLPNVGKSSLFNALVEDSAAIVSPQSGATRDFVSATWQVTDLIRCQLFDTAGIDDAAQGVDRLAQQHSGRAKKNAAIRILCLDGTTAKIADRSANDDDDFIAVVTKADHDGFDRESTLTAYPDAIAVSAHSGAGLTELRQRIAKRLLNVADAGRQATAARCGESLNGVRLALKNAIEASQSQLGEELVAAELRLALDELGRIVGAIYNDDVLDRVFSRFCIGK